MNKKILPILLGLALTASVSTSFATTALLKGVLQRITNKMPVSNEPMYAQLGEGGILVETGTQHMIHAKESLKIAISEEPIVSGFFQTGTQINVELIWMVDKVDDAVKSALKAFTEKSGDFAKKFPQLDIKRALVEGQDGLVDKIIINADEVDAKAFDTLINELAGAI